ncbi:carbohydrate binding domain-containing protein [Patescibacteria group bacterium]|nr:carbohydrate binding domain-containing protein [Patescibacteria group bacterium]
MKVFKKNNKISKLITGLIFFLILGTLFLSPVFLVKADVPADEGMSYIDEIGQSIDPGMSVIVEEPSVSKDTFMTKVQTWIRNFKDELWRAKDEATAVAWKKGLDNFLQNIAYDIGTQLGSGGEGGKPAFYTDGWGTYLRNAADSAAGVFIEDVMTETWRENVATFVCEPDYRLKLAITLGLQQTQRPKAPKCTLTELIDNWDAEINNPDFLKKLSKSFDPYESELGVVVGVYTNFFQRQKDLVDEKTKERISGLGFKPITSGIAEVLVSPDSTYDKTFEQYLANKEISEATPTGYIVADAVGTFLNTLMANLLQTLWDGLWSPDSQSGSYSSPIYNEQSGVTSSGSEAAEERFSHLLELDRRIGGPYEVLQKLVICRDESNPGPTDCVITEKFEEAIEQQLTVEQALKQGLLDGEIPFGYTPQGFEPPYKEGYPYRSILILRKYRIIPVGWEIAAQYINQYGGGQIYDLNDLIEGYDDPNSYFYGLVDPSWVLKAPELYCGLEGYGPIIEDVLNTGERSVTRIEYCADEKSCIDEDENGNCRYYGYCTKEKRIWRLDGDACPDYYNTCTTYTATASEQNFSYLKNTLDFYGCNADNAGCQWLCTEYNAVDRIWTCEAQNERVLKKCENVGVCTGSVASSCIYDSQCPFGETCEGVGCDLDVSCTISGGSSSCEVEGVVLNYNCPPGSTCEVEGECTIPYNGTSCTISGCDIRQSLVPNYSFESAPTNINQVALNWQDAGNTNTFLRVTGSGEKVYSGSYSTRFYSTGGPGYCNLSPDDSCSSNVDCAPGEVCEFKKILFSDPITLSASTDYSISGWYYNNLVVGNPKFEVYTLTDFNNADYSNPVCETVTIYSRGIWINIGCNFTVGIADLDVVVELVAEADDRSPVGTVWFDNIDLQEECLSQSVELALVGSVEKDQSKIFLDRDAQTCDQSDVGCFELIRLQPGTNILYNGSFENNLDSWTTNNSNITLSTDQRYVGGQSASIVYASGNSSPALSADVSFLKPNTEYVVSGYVYIPDSTIIADDWYLDLQAYGCNWNTIGNADDDGEDDNYCYYRYDEITDQYILPTLDTPSVITNRFNISTRKESWQPVYFRFRTNSRANGTGLITLGPTSITGSGTIYFDGVAITEGSSLQNYSNYGSTNVVNLKKPPQYLGCTGDPANNVSQCNDYALMCSAQEVGCNLYTPADGDPAIPAIALSKDYCPAECVGYQAFKQSAANYEREIFPEYFIPTTAETCSSTQAGCEQFTNLDEVARGGEGLEYFTYIRQCIKPSQSDCGTYYTWVGSGEAGFQLRVYSLEGGTNIPPEEVDLAYDFGECENAADALENPYCKEFYNQRGTISYNILQETKSCTDDCHPYRISYLDSNSALDEDACDTLNNPTPTGGTGNGWVDDGDGLCFICGSYGGRLVNPDNARLGDEYCIYDAVPSEGASCSASAAGCREYKGNSATNVRIALYDDFETGTTENWTRGTISNESLVVAGHSIRSQELPGIDNEVTTLNGNLGVVCDPNAIASTCDSLSDDTCYNPETGYCQALDANNNICNVRVGERWCSVLYNVATNGKTYILNFWAKSDTGANQEIDLIIFNSHLVAPENNWIIEEDLVITPNWQYFSVGPFYTSTDLTQSNHIFSSSRFSAIIDESYDGNGTDSDNFFIDNFELKEVSQYNYLIKDSWNTPQSCDTNPLLNPENFPPPNAPQYMLGCEEYTDFYGQTAYLKSFSNLCRESAVGCEALIDTHNSSSPYQQIYNEGFAQSEIVVPQDNITYLVNTSEKQCSAQSVGCTVLGVPSLDPNTGEVISTYSTYLINDPDQYESILCSEDSVGCKEYQSSQGFDYFKDPGLRTCQYKKVADSINYGWYKTSTNSGEPDCPVVQTQLGVTRPDKVCQGGPRNGLSCDNNTFCPDGLCANWVGECEIEFDSCSEFIDPISLISENILFNGSFEQNIDVNSYCFGGVDCTPDGWEVEDTAGLPGGVLAVGVEDSVGIRAVLVEGRKIIQGSVQLKPYTLYTLSAYIKKNQLASGVARVEVYNANRGCGDYLVCGAELTSPDNSLNVLPNQGLAYLSIDPQDMSDSEYTLFTGRFFSNEATQAWVTFGELQSSPVAWWGADDGHYFDNLSLAETGIYYYLDNSINKSGCNGLVDYDEGCVLFNNRGNINYSIGEDEISYLLFNADKSPTADGVASTECINSCNSDELISVRQDRTCGEWLSCSSVVKNITPEGLEEDYCVALNNCASMDINGNCDYVLPTPTLVQNQTFEISEITKLSNLSGYSTVGVNWGGGIAIQGLYHYSLMEQIGELAKTPNGNFELYYSTLQPLGWTNFNEPWDVSQFKVIENPVDAQQKEGVSIIEGRSILKVNGEHVASSEKFSVFTNTDYIISAKVNTLALKPQEAKGYVNVYSSNGVLMDSAKLPAGENWTQIVTSVNSGSNILLYIELGNEGGVVSAEGGSYFDEVEIRPALNIQESHTPLAASCRVYPQSSSLSCNYIEGGLEYKGLKGYCLLRDPKNSDICLQWWPVDLIKGDTFGSYPAYSEKTPLYYCVNAEVIEKNSDYVNWNGNEPPDSGGSQLEMWELQPYTLDMVTDTGLPYAEFSGSDSGHDSGDCNLAFWVGQEIDEDGHVIWSDAICPHGRPIPAGGACRGIQQFYFDIAWVREQGGDWSDAYWIKYFAKQSWQDGSGPCPCAGSDGWDDFSGYFQSTLDDCFEYFDTECTAIVNTVTATGANKAWLARISEGSDYVVPVLNYEYTTDYRPFGSVSPPAPIDNPTLWSGDSNIQTPLAIEPPDVVHYSFPYQARGGSPYSCVGDWDCNDAGNRVATPIQFSSMPNTITGAVELLERLFAKSYGIWIWNSISERYEPYDTSWDVPYILCDGPFNSRQGAVDDYCAVAPRVTNIKVNNEPNGPVSVYNSVAVSLEFNVGVDSNQLPIVSYRVDWGDGNQITVSGTKLRDQTSENNPFSLAHVYSYWDVLGKNVVAEVGDIDDDYIYCTGYEANGPAKKGCIVRPRIQIVDNWGWCNGNINNLTRMPYSGAYGYSVSDSVFGCYNDVNVNAWQYYPTWINVYAEN